MITQPLLILIKFIMINLLKLAKLVIHIVLYVLDPHRMNAQNAPAKNFYTIVNV